MVSKETIIKAQMMISAIYGKQDLTIEEKSVLVDVWCDMFKNYTNEQFEFAVRKCLEKTKFRPTPAHIFEELDLLENADFIPNEIWENFMNKDLRVFYELGNMFKSDLILDSGHNQGFMAKEKARAYFDVIDTSLQIFFGNVDAILELGMMTKENIVFERARYIKEAKNLKKQAETKQLVSDNDLKLSNNDKKQLN